MISQEQLKELMQRTEALSKYLKIDDKRADVAEREAHSQAPGFWDDPKEAEAFLKKMNSVKSWSRVLAAFAPTPPRACSRNSESGVRLM